MYLEFFINFQLFFLNFLRFFYLHYNFFKGNWSIRVNPTEYSTLYSLMVNEFTINETIIYANQPHNSTFLPQGNSYKVNLTIGELTTINITFKEYGFSMNFTRILYIFFFEITKKVGNLYIFSESSSIFI